MTEPWTRISERFNDRVKFRSLDIDILQLHDVCHNAGIANVPALAFYADGNVEHLIVGVQDSDAIINDIETWLANTKPDNKAVNRSGDSG
ncbi:thioredoxin family protein [uncultured Rubinisphaera sp.]|uniref:thioredoxin family protein n=1 Tax=uncultured Rubinisphaera sp. TaxID=1678686 RepID=UPI0030D84C9A|tara:strand:+ start:483 stop:752 length:270 start_codon:yes stop_codon:yes gene_type:complete